MKKFLSVLLALAVAFTFTFGSTMSAFAATKASDGTFAGYTVEEAKDVLQTAYAQATAEDYVANYDGIVVGANDITTYTIKAADVQKAMAKVYDTLYEQVAVANGGLVATSTEITTVSTPSSITVITGLGTVHFTGIKKTDVAYLTAYIESQATANATYLVEAEKSSFEDYKTFLLGLVDKVDLSVYTTTKKDVAYTTPNVHDGGEYWTAADAAAAEIAYAKAVISHAKFNDTTVLNITASSTVDWKVTSYQALYEAVFGDSAVIKTIPVNDTVTNAVIGLTYKLVNTYATTASEAGDAATLSAAQAAAKAKLAQAIANYKATDAYVATTQDAEINAYVEAQTYIIENTTNKDTIDGMSFSMTEGVAKATTNLGYVAKANAYKADMAAAQKNYTTLGCNWDEVEAAKVIKAELLLIYAAPRIVPTIDETYLKNNKIISNDLTAGQKAAAKIDYSEVVAAEKTVVDDVAAEVYELPVTVTYDSTDKETTITPVGSNATGNYYFETQWSKVKAAIDTYNAAVDASVTAKDLATAKNTLASAITISGVNKIKTASEVYGAVDDVNQTNLNNYAKLAYNQAYTADPTIGSHIYVTFTTVDEPINGTTTPDAVSVNLWYIAKGAETAKDAAAMYKDACAVIDAYKTLSTLKNEAAAVNAMIAALPEKAADVVLADKDAIVAASDAYDALGDTAKKYVTNKVKLDADVKAVEALDAYDVKAKAVALPAYTNVTVADKEAVKAAKEAYEAYVATDAYKPKSLSIAPYNYQGALDNIKDAEAKAIAAEYNALYAKYQANKLTAEDVEAAAALEKAIADFIAEYAAAPEGVDEYKAAKIAEAVAALAPAYDNQDAKADLLDMSRKLTIWRTSKTSIKVTAVGSVKNIKDNGYTVKYSFYKKNPGATSYKLIKTTTSNKYTYTNLKKGTNKFQVKVKVYDADGKLVATKMTYYRAAKIK